MFRKSIRVYETLLNSFIPHFVWIEMRNSYYNILLRLYNSRDLNQGNRDYAISAHFSQICVPDSWCQGHICVSRS